MLLPGWRPRAVFLLALGLALAGCGVLSDTAIGPAQLATAQAAVQADAQADAEAVIRPLVTNGTTPGVVVGILAADGTTHFFGYGVADHASGRTPGPDTLFAVGSLSKVFVAAATATLVQEGRLRWDATLPDLAPGYTSFSPDARQVTLLQLASHTAGMPRQPLDPYTALLFARYLATGRNFYGHLTRNYAQDYLAGFVADRPGEQHYSNIGYGILSDLVALRTGQRMEALIEQRVIQPLGLRCTGYVEAALPCFGERASGHAGDQPAMIGRGKPAPDWSFTALMQPSAGLHSTARDLLTMAAAHLPPASPGLHAVLVGNTVPRRTATGEEAAIAWFNEAVDGHKLTFGVGFVAGFSSYVGLDLEHRTAVVVLQNSFNWDLRAGHLLLLRMAYRAEAATR
jgi:CubicO group peptidase (beta-lactamase class C family)